MTPKSDFLLIGAGTITPKGFMNTANFGKTSLFVKQDYEQQTIAPQLAQDIFKTS